jgi:hypothetical protein
MLRKLDTMIDLLGRFPVYLKAIIAMDELETKQKQYQRTIADASI